MKSQPTAPSTDWILDEMNTLSAIEPAITPPNKVLAAWTETPSHEDELYAQLAGFLKPPLHVIFLAPWLQRGGADLSTVSHIRLCDALGFNCLLITTKTEDSPWLEKLPLRTKVLEFGKLSKHLDEEKALLVLIRLLLQSSARTIHNIQSEAGWEIYLRYGLQLRRCGKRLFATLFCDEVAADGELWGQASRTFPRCSHHLAGVFTDCEPFRQKLLFRTAYPPASLRTIYFPVDKISAQCISVSSSKRILWASRLSLQKAPDVLAEIAELLPDITFDVYGEFDAKISSDCRDRLQSLPNVRLLGRYNSFSEDIPKKDLYSLFLYTSLYDGMPNVVLEAISAGLPVVAPDVGGIEGCIGSASPGLVYDCFDAKEYVARIRDILGDDSSGPKYWESTRRTVAERHSWESFAKSLMAVRDYWPSTGADNNEPSIQDVSSKDDVSSAVPERLVIAPGSDGQGGPANSRRLVHKRSSEGGRIRDLIFDIGMNDGRDTRFYLSKGFRVVALEANPRLVEQARAAFAEHVALGRLIIENVALAESPGEIEFFVNIENDHWSSIYADLGQRRGTAYKSIKVPALTPRQFFEKHGIPYYLKVDIEGCDGMVLQGLTGFRERPKFISIEELNNLAAISELWEVGCRRFKIVNQRWLWQVKCPFPPREGRYVDAEFNNLSSGPFGDEVPGEWMSRDEATEYYGTVVRSPVRDSNDWFDIHGLVE